MRRPRPDRARARALGDTGGVTRYIYGELREPEAILRASAETLDFTRPIAVLLFGILHFFSENDDPARIGRRLMSSPPPGGYVAIIHLARDVAGGALPQTFSRLNSEMAESVVLRTREQATALFGDLENIEPGVVQLPQRTRHRTLRHRGWGPGTAKLAATAASTAASAAYPKYPRTLGWTSR